MLIANDMHRVFVVPSTMCDDPTMVYDKVPAAGCHSIDLLTDIQDVELNLVKDWSEYVASAGEPYLVENLLWSGAKIKASLTDGLKEKLIEKTMGWPVVYQTGVVYFKLIMNFIQDSTPKSSRLLITKLQELLVTDYDGENVRMTCSTIKGAYEILMNKRAVPPDFLDLVFEILERCTVTKFVNHIVGIKTNHEQKVKEIDLNYLLTEAENKYKSIDDWPGSVTSAQDAAFLVSETECWNCGETGHYSRDCPKPKRKGGRGRGGRGRGRGGRSGRKGRGGQGQNRGGGGYNREVDPRFRPPGKDDPRVRSLGDVVEYWCGTCRCWTNHPTDRHSEIAMLATKSGVNESSGDTDSKLNQSSMKSLISSSNEKSEKSFATMLTHFG